MINILVKRVKIKILLCSFFLPVMCLLMLCVCVVVAEQIQVTVQPQSQQAAPGSRVVLTCRASGPPGLSYQWFKGKQEVSPIVMIN